MWVWVMWFLAVAPAQLSPGQLERAIEQIAGNPTFGDGVWGIAVYAPLRDERLIWRNAEKNFRPASNMKILTTLLAFEHLGPAYRFETTFAHTGTISDGELRGDLLVIGSGDPSFSGNYSDSAFHTRDLLGDVVHRLQQCGIRRIRGDIVGLDGFFDQEMLQESWEWDDIGQYYGTPITALSLNDGWIQIELSSDEFGAPSTSVFPSWIPDFGLNLDLTHRDEELDLSIRRAWSDNRVVVAGNLPPCAQTEVIASAWNPSLHCVQVLKGFLEESGVPVDGCARASRAEEYEEGIPLFCTTSLPLADLAQTLMKESQNHYADCFLLTTAKRMTGVGDFEAGAELGEALVARALGVASADELGLSIRDGSGLSSHNALRPSHLVALLRFAMDQPYWREWLATFPSMGLDGTLRERGTSDALTMQRVWAKTGYIFRSRCLSGYVETMAGEPLIFSLMTNNYSCKTALVNAAQDEICGLLVRLKPNRRVRQAESLRNHLSHAAAERAEMVTRQPPP